MANGEQTEKIWGPLQEWSFVGMRGGDVGFRRRLAPWHVKLWNAALLRIAAMHRERRAKMQAILHALQIRSKQSRGDREKEKAPSYKIPQRIGGKAAAASAPGHQYQLLRTCCLSVDPTSCTSAAGT
jgi:hypothetical protein